MNRYTGWKFMLSVVAVMIGSAVTSPAQCSDTCTTDGVTNCTMSKNICQVQINADSSATPPKVCVTLNSQTDTYIEWVTSNPLANCTITFGGSPISPSQEASCFTPYEVTVATGCYTYSSTYCNGSCPGKHDPEVIVTCPGGGTSRVTCGGPNRHK